MVYVQGFHPHSYVIRKENQEEGFSDREVNILGTYYGQITKNHSKESQVVFDNLAGRVVRPNPNSIRGKFFLSDEDKKAALEYENDRYLKILMVRDHKFSFGGLSGGSLLNDKQEVVGVITAQDIFRFEFDEHGLFFDPHSRYVAAEIKKQLFDTMYITPIDSIKDLQNYIRNTR